MVKLIDILKEVRQEELDEFNAKKALATGALALGLAGSPNMAKAQDREPTPITQQQDTTKTASATYTHPNENTARSQATVKARAALATKLGKPEGEISASVVDIKMYQVNGKYECTVTVKSADSINEGIDDPVQPGILKKRLGTLSCTRVRAAKAKLKDKGTHYAKALQRYLNYHC
jgi:hypothetical protein